MPTLAPPRPPAVDGPRTRAPASTRLLRRAIREGQERYFDRCRERVPGFIDRHMSLRGAARRYYPPRPLEILRLALSVMVTPILAVVQLALWAARRGQHPAWLKIRSTVQRMSLPRAHEELARSARVEVFADDEGSDPAAFHELDRCVVDAPSFVAYLRAALEEQHPGMGAREIDSAADRLVSALREGADDPEQPGTLTRRARQAMQAARVRGDLESVVAGEAARADVVNTILTGVVAKVTLGQLKLGAYGIALLIAPSLYFRWSSGREEKVRRAIDGILPDGPWSLSRAGWSFEWTDSLESFALMVGVFLAVSAALSVIGYLLAPVLSPVWRLTGLPAWSLRRTVEASRKKVVDGRGGQSLSPEVFAAKVGDLAELFLRSG